MLFRLKRSFAALAPSICLTLYKAFIRPHLEYLALPSHHTQGDHVGWDEHVQKTSKDHNWIHKTVILLSRPLVIIWCHLSPWPLILLLSF